MNYPLFSILLLSFTSIIFLLFKIRLRYKIIISFIFSVGILMAIRYNSKKQSPTTEELKEACIQCNANNEYDGGFTIEFSAKSSFKFPESIFTITKDSLGDTISTISQKLNLTKAGNGIDEYEMYQYDTPFTPFSTIEIKMGQSIFVLSHFKLKPIIVMGGMIKTINGCKLDSAIINNKQVPFYTYEDNKIEVK